MTEVFLVAPARTATVHVASYLQIAVAEVRIKAVTGLMITVETHAGTVSLRPPNSPRGVESERTSRAWRSYCTCGTYVSSPSEPHVLYSSRLSLHSFVVSFADDISAIRAVLCPEPPLTMTKDVLSVCLSVWNA